MVLSPNGKYNVYQKSDCLDCDLNDDKKKHILFNSANVSLQQYVKA